MVNCLPPLPPLRPATAPRSDGTAALRSLPLATPHLSRLDVSDAGTGLQLEPGAVSELAALPALRALSLSGCRRLSDDTLLSLVALTGLRELRIARARCGPAGGRAARASVHVCREGGEGVCAMRCDLQSSVAQCSWVGATPTNLWPWGPSTLILPPLGHPA